MVVIVIVIVVEQLIYTILEGEGDLHPLLHHFQVSKKENTIQISNTLLVPSSILKSPIENNEATATILVSCPTTELGLCIILPKGNFKRVTQTGNCQK